MPQVLSVQVDPGIDSRDSPVSRHVEAEDDEGEQGGEQQTGAGRCLLEVDEQDGGEQESAGRDYE